MDITRVEIKSDSVPDPDAMHHQRLYYLIIVIIIAALVWGFVGSTDLFIVSLLQTLFPTKTNLQYSVIQIIIYVLLIFLVVYLTDVDASNVFMPSNHFKLSETIPSRRP